MVGDTLADVKMGRSAQLAGSIGVLSGIASKQDLGLSRIFLLTLLGCAFQSHIPITSFNMLVRFLRCWN